MPKIEVRYIDTTKYKVEIWQEEYAESPVEWGNFQIVQFKDNSLVNYGDIDEYLTDNGKLLPAVQAKLKAGKMFTFDFYRYANSDGGRCVLNAGVTEPEEIDGFIIFDDEYTKGASYNERLTYAKQDLIEYTQWLQGEVYQVNIETEDGRLVDSIGGVYGNEGITSFIEDVIGDAEYEAVGRYSGTPGGTYEVSV